MLECLLKTVMSGYNIRIFQNPNELADAAARKIYHITKTVTLGNKSIDIAVSGGNTPRPLYSLLAKEPYKSSIPWQKMHIFWCDERCVPLSHPDSNYGQIKSLLLDEVQISDDNIHPILCEVNATLAAMDYENIICEHFSYPQKSPIFDIVVLGMGEDGHTLSLFPGEIHQDEKLKMVIAASANYQNRPSDRITLTPRLVNYAKNIIFLVSGKEKAQALNSMFKKPSDPIRNPAQRINPVNGSVFWFIDKEAASQLDFQIL